MAPAQGRRAQIEKCEQDRVPAHLTPETRAPAVPWEARASRAEHLPRGGRLWIGLGGSSPATERGIAFIGKTLRRGVDPRHERVESDRLA